MISKLIVVLEFQNYKKNKKKMTTKNVKKISLCSKKK